MWGLLFFHASNLSGLSVHPHTCGVYAFGEFRVGSLVRFIPTHVGFTAFVFVAEIFKGGSSPHMWGLRFAVKHRAAQERFIPTHVGFTISMRSKCALARGSSPHMWGLRSCPSAPRTPFAVHPHTCGVYAISPSHKLRVCGSSPHMWGLLVLHLFRLILRRFIPTHVGFTRLMGLAVCAVAVHPHTCGVYSGANGYHKVTRGSSPHMWGLRRTHFPRCPQCPVHPHTCGVYGRCSSNCADAMTVHPHTCGVYPGIKLSFDRFSL